MSQQQNQDMPEIGFRSVQLLKTQTLGIGSYGKVCKAKCDDLLCAAKIIHETLFDPTAQQQIARHREHRLPFRRFQQECEFMSAIKHPNIVQYLGMRQDPETGLPVLLMELMDDSLTHFLESPQDPVPYHVQVNFCHDITLAISYLHSNGIIHRDLSSNNVLLLGNVTAKVTDFGMAKLGDANPRATRISLTMVPGTDVYMPPEAVKEQPVYTAKIDSFAIGALIIQILTRQWPKPGERHKIVHTTDPRFPTIEARASEIERRQNHISQIDPNHPLLPIALHCLKDSDVERPSAQELCHSIAALKEMPQYTESVRSAQERRPEQENTTEREEQIRELQQQIQQKDHIIQEKDEDLQQKAQQIQSLQQIIGSQNNQLQEKEHEYQQLAQTIIDKDDIIQQKDQLIEERERQLQHVTQQLETSKQVTAQFQTRIHELEQQLNTKSPTEVLAKPQPNLRDPPETHYSDTSRKIAVSRDRLELKWIKAKNAPHAMYSGPDAVVDGDMVYFRPGGTRNIYGYNSTNETWNRLSVCPTSACPLVVVSHLLTTIGGRKGGKMTNQLFSLTVEGSNKTWSEVFPPMPTERDCTMAVCTRQALIVAGGRNKNETTLRTVEIMEVATKQWSTAADLPEPLYSASATICGDRIYILGGTRNKKATNSVYTCSLTDLFLSCRSRFLGERLVQSLQSLSLTSQAESIVWNKVADLPVNRSTCVTLNGQLLAIGGHNDGVVTSDIHIYNTSSNNQWEIISKMTVARYQCFAAVLPNNQLMVVGGYTGQGRGNETDSVEIATII